MCDHFPSAKAGSHWGDAMGDHWEANGANSDAHSRISTARELTKIPVRASAVDCWSSPKTP